MKKFIGCDAHAHGDSEAAERAYTLVSQRDSLYCHSGKARSDLGH